MAREAFLRFREAVMQSSALQTQLVDTVKSQADLVAMAGNLGFEFDAADLASTELTEEELKQVSGGLVPSGAQLVGEKWTTVLRFEKWISVLPFGNRI